MTDKRNYHQKIGNAILSGMMGSPEKTISVYCVYDKIGIRLETHNKKEAEELLKRLRRQYGEAYMTVETKKLSYYIRYNRANLSNEEYNELNRQLTK